MTPLQKILTVSRSVSQTERESGTHHYGELIRTHSRNDPKYVNS